MKTSLEIRNRVLTTYLTVVIALRMASDGSNQLDLSASQTLTDNETEIFTSAGIDISGLTLRESLLLVKDWLHARATM